MLVLRHRSNVLRASDGATSTRGRLRLVLGTGSWAGLSGTGALTARRVTEAPGPTSLTLQLALRR